MCDPRLETAGFAQQMLHLANPVFDGMTFVKGDKGGRDTVFGHLRKLKRFCQWICERVMFGEH